MTDMNDVVRNFDLARKQKEPFFYRVRLRNSDDEFEGPFLLRDSFTLVWGGKSGAILVGAGGQGPGSHLQPGLSEPRVQLILLDDVVSFEIGPGSDTELKPPKQ